MMTEASVTSGRTFTVATVFIDGQPSGLRQIKSCGTRLVVLAAPFAELARVKEYISPWAYVVYVIDDPSSPSSQPTYIGHGDGERKFGDRLGKAICANAQIYVISADENTFDKITTSYVEGRLIQICTDFDVALANTARPYGRGLRIQDDTEQLVGHAEVLLHAAGFTRLDLARRNPPAVPRRLSVTADRDEMVAITDEEMTIVRAEGVPHRIVCRDLRANGYKWNDRFYVMAGSDYAYRTRSCLSDDHRERRKLVKAAKWVAPASDKRDRMTLRVAFHCRSGAFAAKILCGEKVDEDAWQADEMGMPCTTTETGESPA